MKLELKRIEAALEQVDRQKTNSIPEPESPNQTLPDQTLPNQILPNRTLPTQPEIPASRGNFNLENCQPLDPVDEIASEPVCPEDVCPEPVHPENCSDPSQRTPDQICHQAMANPAVAKSLLQDLQMMIGQWTQSIQEVKQQVQALYQEGPIVDGWLESNNPQEYHLCGLNEDGQPWHRDCPSEQVADISLAIVRYQRLQQLLTHKQSLESRLIHLTEGLLETHKQMTELNRSSL